MAGTRKFDERDVLDRAMAVFWERGYDATSVDDLEAATGIKRGSLYNAFRDKQGLFLAALDRYAERFETPMLAALGQPGARRAVAGMFDAQIAALADRDTPHGCLATNTCVEAGPRDDDIGRRVRQRAAAQETAIYEALLSGQANGELEAGRDLRAMARFFAATSRGIALTHRSFGDIDQVRDIAKTALAIFDSPTDRTTD
ncbi:MAG: TetR/AcrR family transcriptional regulator [Minwuiales bacterium]|nr:TetR/AcrR family transcriptional regulator [Minwuiales bacterium]